MLGVPIYNSKHKVIGALGGSYDVTALSRMLFEDLFNGQGCSMIIAQNGEIIAFEEDITLHICQWGSMVGLSAMHYQNRQHNSHITSLKTTK